MKFLFFKILISFALSQFYLLGAFASSDSHAKEETKHKQKKEDHASHSSDEKHAEKGEHEDATHADPHDSKHEAKHEPVVEVPYVKNTNLENILQIPANCYQEWQLPCAIKNISNQSFYIEKLDQAQLGAGASLVFEDATKLRLVNGSIYIDTKHHISIESAFVKISSPSAKFIFEHNSPISEITNLGSMIQVQSKFDPQVLDLYQAYQVKVQSNSAKTAKAQFEFPSAFDLRKTIQLWSALFPGNKSQFFAESKAMKFYWQNAVAKSAQLYKDVVDREIASEQESIRRKKLQAEKTKKRNEELRIETLKRLGFIE